MGGVMKLARQYKLKVVEDAAQAFGAEYKGRKAGTIGDCGSISFYPGKNLGALGDAGAVVTDNDNIAKSVKMLRNYGSQYKYVHEAVGYNTRLDELQAAFLTVKLHQLNMWNKERDRIANKYIENIKNERIVLPLPSNEEYQNVWHIFAVMTDDRDSLEKYLADKGIG